MNLTPNLFPLPTWAPAFQRVPTPLAELNRAFLCGERARQTTQLSAEEAAVLPSCAARLRGRRGLPFFARNVWIDRGL